MSTCSVQYRSPLGCYTRPRRANLQRRCGVEPSSTCCFVSPRIVLLLHLITHACCGMSGGIWAVGVPARAALQCLIGHFPLRRSLIIVQAPAHSRSGSTKPRTSTHLHVGAAAAVAVTVTPCSSRVRPGGGKKGAGGLKSRVRDPPQPVFPTPNTMHVHSKVPWYAPTLLSPARWEGGNAPPPTHHRAGGTMSCSSVACEAVLLLHTTTVLKPRPLPTTPQGPNVLPDYAARHTQPSRHSFIGAVLHPASSAQLHAR